VQREKQRVGELSMLITKASTTKLKLIGEELIQFERRCLNDLATKGQKASNGLLSLEVIRNRIF